MLPGAPPPPRRPARPAPPPSTPSIPQSDRPNARDDADDASISPRRRRHVKQCEGSSLDGRLQDIRGHASRARSPRRSRRASRRRSGEPSLCRSSSMSSIFPRVMQPRPRSPCAPRRHLHRGRPPPTQFKRTMATSTRRGWQGDHHFEERETLAISGRGRGAHFLPRRFRARPHRTRRSMRDEQGDCRSMLELDARVIAR